MDDEKYQSAYKTQAVNCSAATTNLSTVAAFLVAFLTPFFFAFFNRYNLMFISLLFSTDY